MSENEEIVDAPTPQEEEASVVEPEAESDIEKSQGKSKKKKPWVMTEGRKAAFAKARETRAKNIKKRNEDRKIEAAKILLEREASEVRADFKSAPKDGGGIQSHPKSQKPKKKVVIVEESSSDSEPEVIIKRKAKKPEPEPTPPQMQVRSFYWV